MNANTAQAIESEAAHQKAKWGNRAHSISEWLLILDKLTQDAKRAWVTQNGDESAKHEIRQIATTAIACMDQCGTMERVIAWAFPPHQQRVIDECEELEARARKLGAFISNNPVFGNLDPDEQNRLEAQNDIMWQYVRILQERIAAFPNPEPCILHPAPPPQA